MNLKKKFVVGAASAALIAGMGLTPAFAVDDPHILPGMGAVNAGRLAGVDRIGTSLEVAAHAFKSASPRPSTVYIANAADAHLVDSTTAGKLVDGPLVFVSNNSYVAEAVGAKLKDEANKVPAFGGFNKIVAIGGTASVSDTTLAAVAKAANVKKTDRLGGEDRYATADAIANYIYDQAMAGNAAYAGLVADGNLGTAYVANGADSHVVDSMVGGVLDNGPTLLVKPDGTYAESTKTFIKKALPLRFAALGGEAAVTEDAINTAWLIRTLKNDWSTSYDIPALKKSIKELKDKIDGKSPYTSRVPGSSAYMGLARADVESGRVLQVWNNEYNDFKTKGSKALTKYLTDNPAGKTPEQFIEEMGQVAANGLYNLADAKADFVSSLADLFGDVVVGSDLKLTTAGKAKIKAALDVSDGKVIGFRFDDFRNDYLADNAGKAEAALNYWWSANKSDATGITNEDGTPNQTARVSQSSDSKTQKSTASTNGNESLSKGWEATAATAPVAAVQLTAQWVKDQVHNNLEAAKKELAAKNGELALALDKVNNKTELRLGGKDRFETAAWIANEYGKTHGSTFGRGGFTEAYIANGFAMPDAIVGGQLKEGPIMLIRPSGEIPTPVASTLKQLAQWNNPAPVLKVYGIGGTMVIPEAQLVKAVDLIKSGADKPAAADSVPEFTLTLDNTDAFSVAAGNNDTAKVTLSRALTAGETAHVTIVKKSGTGNNVPTAALNGTTVTATGDGTNAFVQNDVYTVTVMISQDGKVSKSQSIDLTVGA